MCQGPGNWKPWRRRLSQWMNESTYQPINKSINQPISQLSINPSINRTLNRQLIKSVKQSINGKSIGINRMAHPHRIGILVFVELEKNHRTRIKFPGAETKTNNILNPLKLLGRPVQPDSNTGHVHWWEVRALTYALKLRYGEQFAFVTRQPYCLGRPKKLCFTTLSLAPRFWLRGSAW